MFALNAEVVDDGRRQHRQGVVNPTGDLKVDQDPPLPVKALQGLALLLVNAQSIQNHLLSVVLSLHYGVPALLRHIQRGHHFRRATVRSKNQIK